MKEKDVCKKTDGAREVKDALVKKALGFDAVEVIEEYAIDDDGEIKLSKKKVTKKTVPPDVAAIKMLIDPLEDDLQNMTDEQLEEEKMRLIKYLAESEKNKKGDKKCEKKAAKPQNSKRTRKKPVL